MTPKPYTPDIQPSDGDWLADVPSEVYHGHSALSASVIKTAVTRTAAHAFAALASPPDSESPAMRLGTAIHSAILEPDTFSDRYVVRPDGLDARTKEGKAWLGLHADSGRTVITQDEAETVTGIRSAIAAHPIASQILSACTHRETSFWTMWADELGQPAAPIKCRPDAMKTGKRPLVGDLKSCRDASPEAWSKQVADYGYHIQAAHYRDCIADLCETTPDAVQFVWICVETSAPFGVAVYAPDDAALEEGLRLRDIGIRRLLDYRADAPIYSPDILPISLPAWAARKMENVIR